MPTITEVRAWAAANGHDIGAKGRIPAPVQAAYDAAHNGHSDSDIGPYPGDDDFTVGAELPPEDTGETPPRRPKSRSPRSGKSVGMFRGRPGGGASKKKRPRVSTEDLLGACWRGLAGMAKPLPPLHRTLRLQAPVAGAILDDAVRDTMLDPILQPLARLAGTGKAVTALVGPPLFVTAIGMHAGQAAAAGQDPNPLFLSVAREGLRTSLMAWLDIAGPQFERAMKREREFESKYGQSVDDMIEWLFSPPADAEQEEANIRRAQGMADTA